MRSCEGNNDSEQNEEDELPVPIHIEVKAGRKKRYPSELFGKNEIKYEDYGKIDQKFNRVKYHFTQHLPTW